MSAPALFLQSVLDPTQTIVGNGVAGQVYSQLNTNGYSWRLVSQDLLGFIRSGTFPNIQNPYAISQQNLVLNWPFRGGINQANSLPTNRVKKSPVGFSITGVPFYSPGANQVLGQRSTLWTVDGVIGDVLGKDEFGGYVSERGEYRYISGEFITNDAWAVVPGVNGQYRQPDGHSRILGWAADGYPIYGPFGYAEPMDSTTPVVKMTSGYRPSIKTNRPNNPVLTVRGTWTRSSVITVKNPSVAAPGLRITAPSLPGEIKVLAVQGYDLVLDTAISVNNGDSLQGNWPLGIFVEDYSYAPDLSTRLDRYNGRFCVTPDFPQGTYAYFITVDEEDLPTYPYIIGDVFYGSLQASPPPPPPPLTWITQTSDLGTLAYNQFFTIPLLAESPGEIVQYTVIAGVLPKGVQLTATGLLTGVPEVTLQGGLGIDVTSKFVVRAFVTQQINGITVISQFRDKTFTITVAGRDLPQFITPAGSLGIFYDGDPIDPIQLLFTDDLDNVIVRVAGGNLPPGITLSSSGLISGYIIPAALVDQPPGYAETPVDEFGYDFLVRASNFNYQFTIEITDGRQSNLRTFEMYVISRDSLTADNTLILADDTVITADQSSDRVPFFTNPEGSIGTVQDDNFFSYKFTALDLDGQQVTYVLIQQSGPDYNWSIPAGLTLDPETGWLYGLLPQLGLSEQTYTIALRAVTTNDPSVTSRIYFYTLTVISGIDTRVTWLSPAFLGDIVNGQPSLFSVAAVSPQRDNLEYRLAAGVPSRLPQGLTLLPSGHIAGNASYATFALDNGTTTFDVNNRNPSISRPTTWDLTYRFTVNTYSPTTQDVAYRVVGITVQNPGTGYTVPPTVTIAPPAASGIRATVESVTVSGGGISSITIDQPGFGYTAAPVVTVSGGGAFATGAVLTAQIEAVATKFLVSENKEFTIRVVRKFNAPLNNLYMEALPPAEGRDIINSLTQNIDLLPPEDIFRADDANFGVADRVLYAHAFGINDATLEEYYQSLRLNHYRKQLILGEFKYAQALDANGRVVYEVIYSEVIDNLVNNEGQSVGKEVTLAYPVEVNGETVTTVYPNSLADMRDQVIDTVGAVSDLLPLWMTSIQPDRRQLGFVPAWVIAYVKPGAGRRILFSLQEQYSGQLNRVSFDVDRYILDSKLSKNWDPVADSTGGAWVPTPSLTTFDVNPHYVPSKPDGSTEVFFGGIDYAINSVILIKGSDLNGIDGVNDCEIRVNTVDANGTILDFFVSGTAPFLQSGQVIVGVSGTTVAGPGTGATFDIEIGSSANTIFDSNSMLFVAPVDNYNTSDAFDKYLVFPKQNILQ